MIWSRSYDACGCTTRLNDWIFVVQNLLVVTADCTSCFHDSGVIFLLLACSIADSWLDRWDSLEHSSSIWGTKGPKHSSKEIQFSKVNDWQCNVCFQVIAVHQLPPSEIRNKNHEQQAVRSHSCRWADPWGHLASTCRWNTSRCEPMSVQLQVVGSCCVNVFWQDSGFLDNRLHWIQSLRSHKWTALGQVVLDKMGH